MPRSTKADAPQADQPTQYVVLHGGVGSWWQGQTITADHLQAFTPAQIQRLLDLGAIAEIGSEAAVTASRDGLPSTTPDGTSVREPVALPEGLVTPAYETQEPTLVEAKT